MGSIRVKAEDYFFTIMILPVMASIQPQTQWVPGSIPRVVKLLKNMTFRGPCIVIQSYNKSQREALISQIYFWNRTLHVSDRFSVHHQESSTLYTGIGLRRTGHADCLLASSEHNLYDIHLLLYVQCWNPDDGQKTCPKHVEFYSKNKFEKLQHLVGFIVGIV